MVQKHRKESIAIICTINICSRANIVASYGHFLTLLGVLSFCATVTAMTVIKMKMKGNMKINMSTIADFSVCLYSRYGRNGLESPPIRCSLGIFDTANFFQILFFKMVQKHQRKSIAIIYTIEICSIGDIGEIVWTFPDHFCNFRYSNGNEYVLLRNKKQCDNEYVHIYRFHHMSP